jgi:hypothetical protein
MAGYQAVNGTLLALESFFTRNLPTDLSAGPINARVQLLGSANIRQPLTGNVLGIYAHRIEIDPHGRARLFPAQGTDANQIPDKELPINVHFLLIASASSATIESHLMAWAMLALANHSQLDISHLSANDSTWTEKETLTVSPAEMSNEDLMRIWDVFDGPYTSSVPYVVRTIRLRLNPVEPIGVPVVSRIFPTGIATTINTQDG